MIKELLPPSSSSSPCWVRQALQERISSLQTFIQEEEEAETDSEDVGSEDLGETTSGMSSDWGQEVAAEAEEEEEEEVEVMGREAGREANDSDRECESHVGAEEVVGGAGEDVVGEAVEVESWVGIGGGGVGGAGVAQEYMDTRSTNSGSVDTNSDDLGRQSAAQPRAHAAAGTQELQDMQEIANAHDQEGQTRGARADMTASPLPNGPRAALPGLPSPPAQDRVARRSLPLESPRLSAEAGPVRPTAKVLFFTYAHGTRALII